MTFQIQISKAYAFLSNIKHCFVFVYLTIEWLQLIEYITRVNIVLFD